MRAEQHAQHHRARGHPAERVATVRPRTPCGRRRRTVRRGCVTASRNPCSRASATNACPSGVCRATPSKTVLTIALVATPCCSSAVFSASFDHDQLVDRHRGDALDQALGALVEVRGLRRLDGQPPLGGLRAGDAITGQQKAFRSLIAEPVRPHPCRRHAPHPRGRVADLGVRRGDHLVGVQRDVGAAGHAVAVDLDHGRLVGVHQAGEAADEPAHHLVVDHRIPRLIGQMVDRLRLTGQHGVLVRAAAARRRRPLRVGATGRSPRRSLHRARTPESRARSGRGRLVPPAPTAPAGCRR